MTEKTTEQRRTGCRPPTGEREIASQRGADSMKLLTIPLRSIPASTVRSQTSSSLSSNTERTNKQAFNQTNGPHSTTTCIYTIVKVYSCGLGNCVFIPVLLHYFLAEIVSSCVVASCFVVADTKK